MNKLRGGGGNTSLYYDEQIKKIKKEYNGEIQKLKEEISNIYDALRNVYQLSGGIEILENSNLNDYINPGNYYCRVNDKVTTLLNCPVSYAFTLKVEYATGVSYVCQTLRIYTTGDTYYRRTFDNKTTWENWRKLY